MGGREAYLAAAVDPRVQSYYGDNGSLDGKSHVGVWCFFARQAKGGRRYVPHRERNSARHGSLTGWHQNSTFLPVVDVFVPLGR